jgi:NCAIR mutase (PurE)-related protein
VKVRDILQSLQSGSLSPEEAAGLIDSLYKEDLGFAVIDSRREERTGYPEVVFCSGKTVDQAEAVIAAMREKGIPVLGTRAGPALAERICSRFPEAAWDETAGTLTLGAGKERRGLVTVVAAGTSDLPAAKEAAVTAEFFGSRVELIADVGVAGIHRLFARLPEIRRARAIVAAAGMEGALAGVIAGLVSAPVIALPTGAGYGASFGGVSALLGMLTSCSPGISVVNIGNGFGAGYQANLINRLANAAASMKESLP